VKPSVRIALSISLLIGASLALHVRSPVEGMPILKPLASFPSSVGGWESRGGVLLEADVLNLLKPTDYVMQRYQDSAGRNLWLYIGYWDSKRKGAQVHSPRDCLPANGWEPLEASRVTIPLAQPIGAITVNRYLVQKGRELQIVYYWYQSQGKAIAGDIAVRVDIVRNGILRHRTDSALVRVSGPVYASVEESANRLVNYIQAMYPFLGEYLPD
jgi:EpsI family protein